jgi:hypothetical protein
VKANAASAEWIVVGKGDPADDAAEQPDSAATTHQAVTPHQDAAEMIDSFAGIRWGHRIA